MLYAGCLSHQAGGGEEGVTEGFHADMKSERRPGNSDVCASSVPGENRKFGTNGRLLESGNTSGS